MKYQTLSIDEDVESGDAIRAAEEASKRLGQHSPVPALNEQARREAGLS